MASSGETKVLVGVLLATLVIIVGGAFIVGRRPESRITPVTETERLVRADDAIAGPAEAAVTVVEFGDFQCPACGSLHPILQQVKQNNTGAPVRFVYRHFPLINIHEHAQLAAEAAVAAQQQGKFWEYHDLLFANQTKLARVDLESYASSLGLHLDEFKRALDDHTYRDAVQQDRADGDAIGVNATPTLFINNVQFTGQYSISSLQAAIDEALKERGQ